MYNVRNLWVPRPYGKETKELRKETLKQQITLKYGWRHCVVFYQFNIHTHPSGTNY